MERMCRTVEDQFNEIKAKDEQPGRSNEKQFCRFKVFLKICIGQVIENFIGFLLKNVSDIFS